MAVSERVKMTTRDGFVPAVADTISTGYVLPLRLFANAKPWSGKKMEQGYQTSLPANVNSYRGLETFSFADETSEVTGEFEHRSVYGTIAISGDDVDLNGATDAQVLDVMKLKFEQLQQSFGQTIATQLWADGTGNGGKHLLGLAAAVATASDVATYGGLARATYTTLAGQSTASGGVISFDNMRTVLRNASAGQNSPTLAITTKTVWDLVDSLILPTQNLSLQNAAPTFITNWGRAANMSMMQSAQMIGLHGVSGFTAITWKGVPFVADEQATSQQLKFLNENTLTWYGLSSQSKSRQNVSITVPTTLSGAPMGKVTQKMFGLSWKGWMEPDAQDGYFGVMILKGGLICSNPRFNGKLTGITTT